MKRKYLYLKRKVRRGYLWCKVYFWLYVVVAICFVKVKWWQLKGGDA